MRKNENKSERIAYRIQIQKVQKLISSDQKIMIANDNVSLSVEALTRLNAKFKPEKSTAMKSLVAALYLAQGDNVLKYTNIIGLLQLDMDRKLKSKCLRLYNMDTMKLAFEVELYYDFANHYNRLDDKFYYFDYPVGTVGLLFRTKEEADIMLSKIRTEAPTNKEAQELIQEMKAKQKKQQEANSWFGSLKRKILGKEEVIEESGQIKCFKKVYNTTVDNEGRFVGQGESPFTVDIMQRMGLTEKEKKNKEVMDMIATDLLIHQLKKQVLQNPQPQLIEIIKQHQKQQQQYLQGCRQSKSMNLPPPSLPPPILSPMNRISMLKVSNRANLMDEIKNNNLRLKHVQTNEKGGINIDLSSMDTVERDDFATALRKKVQMRKKVLRKNQSDDQSY